MLNMKSSFVNLHTHSHYSLLSALPKIPDLLKQTKELGMNTVGLTDLGNLYGAIEFYKACEEMEMKPILGVHVFVVADRHERNGREPKAHGLVLIAKDIAGYQNLVKIVTKSYLEGHDEKPHVDNALLEEYSEGIICLSGAGDGEIHQALAEKNLPRAENVAKTYQSIFGKENFYLELTYRTMLRDHPEHAEELQNIGEKYDIPIVAAEEAFYLHSEDKMAHNALLSVQNSRDNKWSGEDLSLISPEEAEMYFHDYPEALANTKKIADRCNVKFDLGNWVFPNIEIPEGQTYDQALEKRAYEGIEMRGLPRSEEVLERVKYELSVIVKKGYSPYFLVVSDLLTFAKKAGIFATTRGSAGGSLVAYLIDITTINPLEYKLPFERFLNPERPSAPDVDMDLADNRRDEMLQYAREKYGAEKVAQIGTFGTMAARGAVRDITRALGHPYSIGDKIAKLIPFGAQGFPMSIDRAIEEVPELKELYEKEDEVQEIIDMAKKVEGCARHISIHAAGVVISPGPLTDFVPLQLDPKGGKIITQYDMHAVEDAGLLKFDFLGIRHLAILADTIRLVKEIENIEIDIEQIPLDDKKTFELLSRGDTVGLFQLGGSGMTRYLMELKPASIHDINAMVALYRPGPMDVIPEYIRRKNNPQIISYPDPRMEKYLDQSYGLIVYQDDLLYSAIELAGYSWLEADKFRKAVGKKIPEEMAAQKAKLVDGIIKNGQTRAFAEELWKLFEPVQAYGFNKAHAASYGRVAYQSAYLKANYMVIYMTAILSANSGNTERVSEMVAECKRLGIPVLPPSINESIGGFSVVSGEQKNDSIRFGLYTVKNLGHAISDSIIEEREKNGPYTSFENFLDRINHKDLNKKSLESLIMCGALDFLGDRGVLLANVEDALIYTREKASDALKNQDSLFGGLEGAKNFSSFTLKDAPVASFDDRLMWEKDLLGFYLTGHPLEKFRERLAKNKASIKNIKLKARADSEIVAAGILEDVKPIMTKKGDRMAFVTLSDTEDSLELVVFPKVFTKFKDDLTPNMCVVIKGKFSKRNGEPSMIVDKVKKLE
jgi:DNA polymerase-3 subunit alpha